MTDFSTLEGGALKVAQDIEGLVQAYFETHIVPGREVSLEDFSAGAFYAILPIVIAAGWTREEIIAELDKILVILKTLAYA